MPVPILSHWHARYFIRHDFLICYEWLQHYAIQASMEEKFSNQLDQYVRQAGLSLRQIADSSGIPHQTIHNWVKGSQPRWHGALSHDLQRLGNTLGLSDHEITFLQRLAGCISAQSRFFVVQEAPMESTFRIPAGWSVTSDTDEMAGDYDIGVDPEITYEDRPCVTIQAKPESSEFAGLAQQIKADYYHGKRLQFSAAVRSQNLKNRAALFMRVRGANGKLLAFDNMRNRQICGTTDWKHYSIVLDVAEDAEDIMFGFFLSLQGQVWMADVQLESVDNSIPTTDILEQIAPYFPVNLDFED
jgi:transcriptional regulator with XRE-family HTH domain